MTNLYIKRKLSVNATNCGMTTSAVSPIAPMVPASDSQTLALTCNFKQPSTNLFPPNNFAADILTQAMLKMGAPHQQKSTFLIPSYSILLHLIPLILGV